MLRFIALLATVALGHELSDAAELVSDSEVVGTWKIEPSTFRLRPLAMPNTNPRPGLPTNYNAFALVLKKDGWFAATNVPAKLFCDWAATDACSGQWSAWTNSVVGVLTQKTNTYSHFSLVFHEPHFGLWGRPMESWRKNSSSPRKLALHIGPIKDASNTYEWNVLLTKQD